MKILYILTILIFASCTPDNDVCIPCENQKPEVPLGPYTTFYLSGCDCCIYEEQDIDKTLFTVDQINKIQQVWTVDQLTENKCSGDIKYGWFCHN